MNLRPLHILIGVVIIVILGAMAWGIGWVAHSLLSQQATPPPMVAVEPTVILMTSTFAAPTSTALAASPLPAGQTGTPRPTSTLRPTVTPSPTPAHAIVQPGEGLYEICRRHCPNSWPDGGISPGLEEYARDVARINSLRWGWWGPRLKAGQRLEMPHCP